MAVLCPGMKPGPGMDHFMATETAETIVTQKTRELCQALIDEPGLRTARQSIDAFLADNKAQSQYEQLMAKGQTLQEKQRNSEALTPGEIADFEQDRDALLSNPVARNFLDAQEHMHDVQQAIHKQVNKTLELGRLPTSEDLEEGSCGHGCGCHH
jgi:cell fate (sporulation/competence/biofilm development) regulator YlbF (YheA/YmcA/DUF963 family)